MTGYARKTVDCYRVNVSGDREGCHPFEVQPHMNRLSSEMSVEMALY